MTLAIELPRAIHKIHGGVWARAAAERDLDETFMTAVNVLAEVNLIERLRIEEADPHKSLQLEVQLYRDVLEAISQRGRGTTNGDAKCAEAALRVNKADLNRRCSMRRAHVPPKEVKATGAKMLDAKGNAWTLLPWERIEDIAQPAYWIRHWRNFRLDSTAKLELAAKVDDGLWYTATVSSDSWDYVGNCKTIGEGKRLADEAILALLTLPVSDTRSLSTALRKAK